MTSGEGSSMMTSLGGVSSSGGDSARSSGASPLMTSHGGGLLGGGGHSVTSAGVSLVSRSLRLHFGRSCFRRFLDFLSAHVT